MKENGKRGIGWKIYFVVFILFGLLGVFDHTDFLWLWVPLVILKVYLTSTVLYSWIWAKRIGWLSKIRWLIKLWSIQFFIAPIALLIRGYSALTQANEESIGWVITIAVAYPALYGVYRIAWKSNLLYKKIDVPVKADKP